MPPSQPCVRGLTFVPEIMSTAPEAVSGVAWPLPLLPCFSPSPAPCCLHFLEDVVFCFASRISHTLSLCKKHRPDKNRLWSIYHVPSTILSTSHLRSHYLLTMVPSPPWSLSGSRGGREWLLSSGVDGPPGSLVPGPALPATAHPALGPIHDSLNLQFGVSEGPSEWQNCTWKEFSSGPPCSRMG